MKLITKDMVVIVLVNGNNDQVCVFVDRSGQFVRFVEMNVDDDKVDVEEGVNVGAQDCIGGHNWRKLL